MTNTSRWIATGFQTMNQVCYDWTPESIADFRDYLGMARIEFANMLEVRETTIYRWEKGQNKIDRILKLALTYIALKEAYIP